MSTDDKPRDHSQMTALERKYSRNRPPLLSQEVLDRVAREHAAFFRELGAERGRKPSPDDQPT